MSSRVNRVLFGANCSLSRMPESRGRSFWIWFSRRRIRTLSTVTKTPRKKFPFLRLAGLPGGQSLQVHFATARKLRRSESYVLATPLLLSSPVGQCSIFPEHSTHERTC